LHFCLASWRKQKTPTLLKRKKTSAMLLVWTNQLVFHDFLCCSASTFTLHACLSQILI
jgi:hypothetical protein